MNTQSESRDKNLNSDNATGRVLVWDIPVRLFHWLMVLSFAGAYLSAESERWRLLHVTLGYTLAGLVIFRILWGFVGTRYARFSNFVRGPKAVARYVGTLLHKQPEHHTGHNPAGALAILGILGLALLVAVSGWAVYNDVGGDWFEEAHEFAANAMLAIVGIHIAGVLVSSWMHRENLIGAMFSGRKTGQPNDGIRRSWWSVAGVMLVLVLGFWWLQWNSAAPLVGSTAGAALSTGATDADGDDD